MGRPASEFNTKQRRAMVAEAKIYGYKTTAKKYDISQSTLRHWGNVRAPKRRKSTGRFGALRTYTEEQRTRAIELGRDGARVVEIAQDIGATPGAVGRWLRTAGVVTPERGIRKYSVEQQEKALALAERVGVTEATRQIGISAHTIHKWRRESRLEKGNMAGKTGYPEETRTEALQMLRDGATVTDTAHATGATTQAVRRWAYDGGIAHKARTNAGQAAPVNVAVRGPAPGANREPDEEMLMALGRMALENAQLKARLGGG